MSKDEATLRSNSASPDLTVPATVQDAIAQEITSADSPVGIDARKTHIVIIHLLLETRDKLAQIESRLRVLEASAARD